MSNFEMTYQLGKALVMPNVQRRYENPNGLRIAQVNKMRQVLGLEQVNYRPPAEDLEDANIGRCQRCVEELVGLPTYTQKRNKLHNKLKVKC